MPRDARLYITLPLDIHRHPKLRDQPAEVKWTFVEMNIEARLAENDGRFTAEDAEFLWPAETLAALVRTHPSRPVVVRDGTDYVIREYGEHQLTKAARDDLRAKRAEAGRKGGKSRASAKQVLSTHKQTEAESESESEDSSKTYKSQSSSERASVSTDSEAPSEMTRILAGQAGITSLQSVIDSTRKHAHRTIGPDGALQLATQLLGKARTYPRNPQMYVTRSISLSAFEVQQFVDERGLAVTS